MRALRVFNSITLDGYFAGAHGDLGWAHERQDDEWRAFTTENASGGGELVFGRVTYEMMVRFWPTPEAHDAMPVVAEQMNRLPKVVFSRTLTRADWPTTTIAGGDLAEEVARLKAEPGGDIVAYGGFTLAQALTRADLVDEYRLMVRPVALGSGEPMFSDLTAARRLDLVECTPYPDGTVISVYRKPS